MRRRNIKQAKDKIKQYDCLISPKDLINFKDYFKNDNPLHLEIGMGKGQFIINLAKNNPNINYLGLEKYESVILQALKKKENEHLDNLLLICDDCLNLLNFINKKSIDKIYLNFSDPWPKARHEKRRLTSNTFLKIYEAISKDKTLIEMKTDNRGLFEYSIMNLTNNHYQIEEIHLDLHKDFENIITTEYEDRFSKDNNPIYFMRVSK